MSALRWGEPDRSTSGLVERRFDADVAGRTVPGLLWHAAGARGPRPLVLLGHGATRHKRVEYLLALARLLVRRYDIAAAAIDGPGHGERRQGGPVDDVIVFGEFLAEWSRPGTTDDVVTEWSAVLTGLRETDEVGDGPLGYWGLSMGTIYGIPLAAAEPRIQAAVFGLMGLVGPTQERMASDAAAVACPVLFLAQWDDSLIPRQHAFELFDAIGSMDKRLHAHPGEHAAVPAEELEFSARFLARHLEGATPGN